jgi:hypothetical protein
LAQISKKREQLNSAQESTFFGDFRPSEKLSEIKPPLIPSRHKQSKIEQKTVSKKLKQPLAFRKLCGNWQLEVQAKSGQEK